MAGAAPAGPAAARHAVEVKVEVKEGDAPTTRTACHAGTCRRRTSVERAAARMGGRRGGVGCGRSIARPPRRGDVRAKRAFGQALSIAIISALPPSHSLSHSHARPGRPGVLPAGVRIHLLPGPGRPARPQQRPPLDQNPANGISSVWGRAPVRAALLFGTRCRGTAGPVCGTLLPVRMTGGERARAW